MILLFSDIHGNKQAAQQIQQLSKGVSDILFTGDICGYGKDFQYCIDMFMDLNIHAVYGNHDKLVINGEDLSRYDKSVAESIKWTRNKIGLKHYNYLKNLPKALTKCGIYFTHTIDNDTYITNHKDGVKLAKKTNSRLIAFGHTHIQDKMQIGDKILINPGSITKGRKGNPRGYVIINEQEPRFIECEDIL